MKKNYAEPIQRPSMRIISYTYSLSHESSFSPFYHTVFVSKQIVYINLEHGLERVVVVVLSCNPCRKLMILWPEEKLELRHSFKINFHAIFPALLNLCTLGITFSFFSNAHTADFIGSID